MEHKAILAELYSKQQGPIKLNLSRIRNLSQKLQNPQKKMRSIHVGGSNGKGSSCAFLFSILRAAGYRVGLYTSPHLRYFNERIRINDVYISNTDIARLYSRIRKYMGDATFFEITTMMAFLYFAEKKCDIAIIEVGLGGRLDATNIITPLVSAITGITLEHTAILGNTIRKIAKEKGGIIKRNVPVVSAAKGPALEVIKQIAKGRDAPLTIVGKLPEEFSHVPLGLKGEFQEKNAAIAIALIGALNNTYGWKIPKKAMMHGLKYAKWPGRMEYIGKNILVDCAHNAEGMALLGKELQKIKRKKIFVMGILSDKDIPSMMRIANRHADFLILTRPKNERAAEPIFLSQFSTKSCVIIPNPGKALKEAKKRAKKGDLIVITGSIYLVGEYTHAFKRKPL